ncbi:unnamed protein product [Candida verbasci]|uniref:Lysyl-tRNA synthetase n=1 Tax=Candida verbasci TaxID=1227364 RepID=A0A9W4U0G5_9ASCO|nr:unnamed protein product [Candida verbasci]
MPIIKHSAIQLRSVNKIRWFSSTIYANFTNLNKFHQNLTDNHRSSLIKIDLETIDNDSIYYPTISKFRKENPNSKLIDIHNFRKLFDNAVPVNVKNEYLIEGRIKSIRKSGKGMYFIDITHNNERLQILASNNLMNLSLEEFDIKHAWFKIGDIIGCNGVVSRTKTGELTLKLNKPIRLLTPRLKEIPDKITDKSLINRNRVLNYLSNPDSKRFIIIKSQIIETIRNFLIKKNFLEVQTPLLIGSGTGANANPFVTKYKDSQVHLRVAPELWLKKLVIGGFDKVFEIGTNFRNEGIDQTHNPEFTSCEFYQTYTSLDQLIELTEELFNELFLKFDIMKSVKFIRYEFLPTLESQTGLSFQDLSLNNLIENFHKLNLQVPPNPNPANLLNQLSEIYLESLSITKHKDIPVVIYNQPEILSPLAKSMKDENGNSISLRFELFVNGKELVNAYEEENNPVKQHEKFKLQQSNKIEFNDEESLIPDWTYIQTMEYGLPPTGGWGCGIERLTMLISNAERIDNVLSFGNLRDVMKQ